MHTRLRSFSKINLGLAIGPIRSDGFHGLTTIYQTLALHDLVTVTARRAQTTSITLTTNHPFVPRDARNTAWKMAERFLARTDIAADVRIDIDKRLPVQGGMGAGSANAAAALLGLERELGVTLPEAERFALAASVGSDVPLFLIGGAVRGTGRGEVITAMADLPATPCVIATPGIGVSTPQAFRDWDALPANDLTSSTRHGTLHKLSLVDAEVEQNASTIWTTFDFVNDFEQVVFPQHPSLRETKHLLIGSGTGSEACYAALSGSGSALFGLYRSQEDAEAAQHRVQASGVKTLLTATLPQAEYWRTMFAG